MKTIKQLADELGVSKTAVRNYMDADFRAKYTTKDDKEVITITPEGCEVIAQIFEKRVESTPETSAETALITIPRSVLQLLEEQLREKDNQIRSRDQQIADLTAAVNEQAQSINADRHNELAGTMQQFLPGTSSEAQFEPVEAFQGEEVQKPAQNHSDAQNGLQEAVSSLKFGERVRLLLFPKRKE